MPQFLNYLLLATYLLALYALGRNIIATWFGGFPKLLSWIGAMLVGTGVGVPLTYCLSVSLVFTHEPILWAVGAFMFFVLGYWILVGKRRRTDNKELTASDVLLFLFSLAISAWLMTKTFHGGPAGELFVGSNNVFDFGHALGIVRSFSWGNNIPFASPFEAGLPFFYHFFFYFFVAIWEYFGVPIVWALNIPSILSFAALLTMVYFLPQILLKQRAVVGWVAVILTITHSTLTFWYLIMQKGFNLAFFHTVWRLPAYPFAGPFDGSMISIFMTLNNYVNQRHLAFGIALWLFIFMCLAKLLDDKRFTKAKSVVFGVLTGFMFWWNMAVSILAGAMLMLYMLVKRKLHEATVFSITAIVVVVLSLLPFIPMAKNIWSLALSFQVSQAASAVGRLPQWSIFQYWWGNLGILPFVALLGYLVIPRQRRISMLPFVVLFVFLCLYAALGKHGFDQKFLSFLIIGVNAVAAVGIGWLWGKGRLVFRLFALTVFFVLSVSGVVDLMVIKNEFAFPLVGKETIPLISWIKTNTPKDAVFISYADMIDPVAFSGRKNYFGYFANIGWYDRSSIVTAIYKGDVNQAAQHDISYILVPKWQKSNFPYVPDLPLLRQALATVYEDDRYIMFEVQ